MRWFIADTHFCHKNIIEYDNRPFESTIDMDLTIIKRWNGIVQPTDTVYHLGDFAFAPNAHQKRFINHLNGYKVLIRGNHDKSETACFAHGWNFVCDGLLVNLDGYKCLLVHDPADSDASYFTIHGHTHQYNGDPYGICVSCNLWNYEPISEKTMIKEIKKKKKEQKDMGNPITY